jgi:acyl carrier protein
VSADNSNGNQIQWDGGIGERVRKIVMTAQCPIPANHAIEPTDRLDEDFGFDSIDNVEFIVALEDTFDVVIDDDEAGRLRTFGDVVSLLRNKNVNI